MMSGRAGRSREVDGRDAGEVKSARLDEERVTDERRGWCWMSEARRFADVGVFFLPGVFFLAEPMRGRPVRLVRSLLWMEVYINF